jgi:hypothetical protein
MGCILSNIFACRSKDDVILPRISFFPLFTPSFFLLTLALTHVRRVDFAPQFPSHEFLLREIVFTAFS